MLRIQKSHVDEMIDHAREAYPDECCGFLAGADGTVSRTYRVSNVHEFPRTRFEMNVQEHITARRDWEANDWDALAIYHSHPNGKARPSHIDVNRTLQGGWWDVFHVLVSLEDQNEPCVRAFQITRRGEIIEQELEIC